MRALDAATAPNTRALSCASAASDAPGRMHDVARST